MRAAIAIREPLRGGRRQAAVRHTGGGAAPAAVRVIG
jgi:hypothetical protein